MKRKLTIGIVAHVDAGKTTLSEALLFRAGKIRSLGRVDHKNTYLDTDPVERERGITVFSKQARFSTEHCDFILLDTPGHVDFSAEAERTLALLDYAILVISGPDGVQNHTRTLWQLLEFYRVPTFLFVNKTDIAIKLKQEMAEEIAAALSPRCVPFYPDQSLEAWSESVAMADEALLEQFLSGEPIDEGDIALCIAERRLFPCLFGAALRMEGIDFLLETVDRYARMPVYDDGAFGARVYKIARAGSTRLTYMKITGGRLSVRDELGYRRPDGEWVTEKVSQLRLYSGEKFEQVDSASAGEICAVVGLSATYVGQGFGQETDSGTPVLEPVLSYRAILPPDCDPMLFFPKLKELEEEEPSLHLLWNQELQQIEARFMGEIQIELLRRMIADRFGIDCGFDTGRILYRETIAARTVGVGHYEPLRHYAEVQLLMEPQPRGTGLVFDVRMPENQLEINWQRLILSHLYQKDHRGVLTGAMLTDTKITLVAGRAHLKHTEGGDFREATLRAVRQGLMKAGCVLLEPYYRFRLEIPSASVGRAMSDLQSRFAEFETESSDGQTHVLCGRGPVSTLHDYPREVISYTHGKGRLFCTSDGYEPCHNAEAVVTASAYDPETDDENPSYSVFCARGAGFAVPWDQVDAHKHVEAAVSLSDGAQTVIPKAARLAGQYQLSDEDLEAIMLHEFGPIRRKQYSEPKRNEAPQKKRRAVKAVAPRRSLVIVDGYNVIHSWESLREDVAYSLEKARESLMDILSNYVAFTKIDVILVFDAYLVEDGRGSDFIHDGYRVVYTRKDQTADAFIEETMAALGPDYNIRVVTGDRLLQYSAVHSGILRMTALEFEKEVVAVGREITELAKKLAEGHRG